MERDMTVRQDTCATDLLLQKRVDELRHATISNFVSDTKASHKVDGTPDGQDYVCGSVGLTLASLDPRTGADYVSDDGSELSRANSGFDGSDNEQGGSARAMSPSGASAAAHPESPPRHNSSNSVSPPADTGSPGTDKAHPKKLWSQSANLESLDETKLSLKKPGIPLRSSPPAIKESAQQMSIHPRGISGLRKRPQDRPAAERENPECLATESKAIGGGQGKTTPAGSPTDPKDVMPPLMRWFSASAAGGKLQDTRELDAGRPKPAEGVYSAAGANIPLNFSRSAAGMQTHGRRDFAAAGFGNTPRAAGCYVNRAAGLVGSPPAPPLFHANGYYLEDGGAGDGASEILGVGDDDIDHDQASPRSPFSCVVCGEEASGNFFGALTCLPCKSFFIRCTKDTESCIVRQCRGQCDINKQLRNRCQYCRYQRCLAAGMTRKEKPESIQAMDGQELCRVCGDLSNGIHFGVFTCEGCKKFFRRGLKEHKSYVCKDHGMCRLTPRSRNSCRLCRFRKCIDVGMSRTAIKMGRPRKLFATWGFGQEALMGQGQGYPNAYADNLMHHMSFSPRREALPEGPLMLRDSLYPKAAAHSRAWGRSLSEGGANSEVQHIQNSLRHAHLAPGILEYEMFQDLGGESSYTPRQPLREHGLSPATDASRRQAVAIGDNIYPPTKVEAPDFPQRVARAASSFPQEMNESRRPGVLTYNSECQEAATRSYIANRSCGSHLSNKSSRSNSISTTTVRNHPAYNNYMRNAHSAGNTFINGYPNYHSNTSAAGPINNVPDDVDVKPLVFFKNNAMSSAEGQSFTATEAVSRNVTASRHAQNNAKQIMPPWLASREFRPNGGLPCNHSRSEVGNIAATHLAMKQEPSRRMAPYCGDQRQTDSQHYAFSEAHTPASNARLAQRMFRWPSVPRQQQRSRSNSTHNTKTTPPGPLPPLIQAQTRRLIPPTESLSHTHQYVRESLSVQKTMKTEDVDGCRVTPITTAAHKSLPPVSSLVARHSLSDMQRRAETPALDLRVVSSVSAAWHSEAARNDLKRKHENEESIALCSPNKLIRTNEDVSPFSERDASYSPHRQVSKDIKTAEKTAQGFLKHSSPQDFTDTPRAKLRGEEPHGTFDPFTNERTLQDINTMFNSVDIEAETSLAPGEDPKANAILAAFDRVYAYSPFELSQYWRAVACTAQKFDVASPSEGKGGSLSEEQRALLAKVLLAYRRQRETIDEGLHPPAVDTNQMETWPPQGEDANHWRHLQERIARQTFAETQFVLQLSATTNTDLGRQMGNSHLFGSTILLASREWFDPARGTFRYFWNWDFPETHPLELFRKRITSLGRRIHELKMDVSEVALLSALNIANCYHKDLKYRKQSLRHTHTLVKLLGSHLKSVKVSPYERIPELMAVMAPLRHMSLWYSNLIKNLRADPGSVEQTLYSLSQLAASYASHVPLGWGRHSDTAASLETDEEGGAKMVDCITEKLIGGEAWRNVPAQAASSC